MPSSGVDRTGRRLSGHPLQRRLLPVAQVRVSRNSPTSCIDSYDRWHLWEREKALREECDYKGAQPYWDWSLDVAEAGAQYNRSPIFDPVYGFGGNGIAGSSPLPPPEEGLGTFGDDGSCISDGPFKNLTVHLGPDFRLGLNPRCLEANLQPDLADATLGWNSSVVPVLESADYATFCKSADLSPVSDELPGIHPAGHLGVAGSVSLAQSRERNARADNSYSWRMHGRLPMPHCFHSIMGILTGSGAFGKDTARRICGMLPIRCFRTAQESQRWKR